MCKFLPTIQFVSRYAISAIGDSRTLPGFHELLKSMEFSPMHHRLLCIRIMQRIVQHAPNPRNASTPPRNRSSRTISCNGCCSRSTQTLLDRNTRPIPLFNTTVTLNPSARSRLMHYWNTTNLVIANIIILGSANFVAYTFFTLRITTRPFLSTV